MHESFPPVEKPISYKKDAYEELLKKGEKRKSRFILAALAAIGLHAPLTPQGREIMESILGTIEMKGVEGTYEILEPQSEVEKKEILERMEKRLKRADADGLEAYKGEQRKKLDQGEPESLKEMFFNLERLNGVPAPEVEAAEQKADEMISKFKSQMKGEISRGFINVVVHEMYGNNSNYEWGQGSVVKYFNTGKRNCVSIATAEQIVLEDVLSDLSEEVRSKIHIGREYQKQHVMATLTFDSQVGDIKPVTLRLEPPVGSRAENESGTAWVSLNTQKQALVSDKFVAVKSAGGGRIKSTPDLMIVSDQPVNEGIAIEGALRSSDYVERIVKERDIKPVVKEFKPTEGAMDLIILKENMEPTLDEVRKQIDEALKKPDYEQTVELKDIKKITPEIVKEIAEKSKKNKLNIHADISEWDTELIEELLVSDIEKFSIDFGDKLEINKLIESVQKIIKNRMVSRIPVIRIVFSQRLAGTVSGGRAGLTFDESTLSAKMISRL